MKTIQKNHSLSHGDIEAIAVDIKKWLGEYEMERSNLLRICLSIEEILLRWQDRFGADKQVMLSMGSRLGQRYICLSAEGEAFDPTEKTYDELDWPSRVLAEMGLAPVYSYKRGVNQVWLKIKRHKSSPVAKLLMAIGLAALLGIGGIMAFPKYTAVIAELFLTPIQDTVLGLLSAVAVPMIFLSVMLGVCGVGDSDTFNKIGSVILIRFITKIMLYAAIAAVVITPLFSLNMGGSRIKAEQFADAIEIILDIAPGNIAEPFVTGNTLQIIVIAVVFGMALLIMGSRGDTVKRFAQEMDSAVRIVFDWVAMLMPLIVFLLVLRIIWTGDIETLAGIWKPILIISAICVAVPAGAMLYTCRKLRVSPRVYLKKVMPTLLLAFATASSAASFSSNVECCGKKLGIHSKIIDFGVPMGSVTFKAGMAMVLLVFALFAAEIYGTSCSAVWMAITWISAVLLGIATPPVAGGSMAIYSVLFAQLGLPAEALVFALAADIIADRMGVFANISLLQLELVLAADSMDLLDREVLRSESNIVSV